MKTKESHDRHRHRQYISTVHVDFGINAYDDLEQNGYQHAPHDYVELSNQDASVYENVQSDMVISSQIEQTFKHWHNAFTCNVMWYWK